ncbi:MAG: 2-oxo acid dehydrogenase subunit E2 [Verrucomicrobiae bacterium]|nr:2-oxo acid dehydrogenase subunit E2 [Verrucomicrobiae bacterium]
MPKLSDTMTEGTLVKWLKQEGDPVAMDESIAEVETDKATMEMQSFDEGTLYRIYVKEGEAVPLGARLAMLLEEGEAPPAEGEDPVSAPPTPSSSSEKESPEPTSNAEPSHSNSLTKTEEPNSGDRVKASPLAKRIAREKGVELSRLSGTGPGGRIVKKDVLSAASGAAKAKPAPANLEDRRIPLTGMRRVIAQRLLESKTSIPHFYLHIEVDAAPLMTARQQLNAEAENSGGVKLTVNDFVLRAAVKAALAVPAVNASFDGDAIIQYGDIHLSVAVAVEQGLVTPVIRSAQRLDLTELSLAMKSLADKARNKRLTPEEMQGGTLTISNLGAYGIDSFDAIINPPQSMILAVGAIVKKPVVNERDEIVPGLRMNIGLSGDHRVVDGAVGAQYLAELRKFLEQPILLLL